MKYRYIAALLFCILFSAGAAFSQAKETTVKFQNGQYPAFTTEYHFPSDVVTQAIQQRLKDDKINAHTKKDVISSQGIQYDALTPQTIDLYFQIEGMGRKGKDGATVNMLVSKGKDNFTGSAQDPELAQNAIQYLDNLKQYVTQYALKQQIDQQQKSIDKQAKGYQKLLKDSKKAESKRYSLQADLSKETDPSKQDKLKKKIDNLDKDINKKQANISDAEQQLQQLKDQLNQLQDQLNAATR